MTATALIIIGTVRVLFGILVYVRIQKIRQSIRNRFAESEILARQQYMFDYVLILMRISILILVSLMAIFIY